MEKERERKKRICKTDKKKKTRLGKEEGEKREENASVSS